MRRVSRFSRFPAGLALVVAAALALAWLALGVPQARAETPTPATPGSGSAATSQIEEGARLYSENCEVCHGPNGQGRVGATLAKDWPSVRPDLTVATIIANGVQGSPMPAWSQSKGGPLTADEIAALTEYILSWQTGGAPQVTRRPTITPGLPITPPPNVEGDPNHGAQLYHENCVMCHGTSGEGRVGATLAKAWPGIRPDLSIKTTISNGIKGSPMPAWSQANGGPLSEVEINDVTSYVLTLGGANPAVQVTAGPPPFPPESLAGIGDWGWILIFVVLFILIVVGVVLLQRQQRPR